MKGFERNNQLLSLCGSNCGLCTMFLGKCCPGCGGGDGNQGCRIASVNRNERELISQRIEIARAVTEAVELGKLPS